MRLKVRHGINGMNWNQEKSLWSFKKVQMGKIWFALFWGREKPWSSWNFGNLHKLSILQYWLSWRLKFPNPGCRKEKTFCRKYYNARPWTSLKIIDHVAYLDWTVTLHWLYSSCFHLFRQIKDWLYWHFPVNNLFISAVKSVLPSLVHIFKSVACRCLFITDKNVFTIVVTGKIVFCGKEMNIKVINK